MELVHRLKTTLNSRYLIDGGDISITPFSEVLQIEGTIPLRLYILMVRDLSATLLKTDFPELRMESIGESTTVLPPGQGKLEKTTFRNPHIHFKFQLRY